MFVFVPFLHFACMEEDAKGGSSQDTTISVDLDQDGYLSTEDCDDSNYNVHPDAIETCDGIDNNCDQQVDEGVASNYYKDEDQDGFGDPAQLVMSCEPLEGYVTTGTDCDDQSQISYPGAIEICDEVDNDCDGVIDEDLIQGLYRDADSDGFGDPSEPLSDCDFESEGYVANTLDCDDDNQFVHVGANEICDDIDNDCDGLIDEIGDANQYWYEDFDNDGFGNPSVSTMSCEQPEGFVTNNEDCDDMDSSQNPSGAEVCNQEDDNCDGIIDLDAIDVRAYYQDSDNDGYGNPEATITQCTPSTGYIWDNTDCDDVNPYIHPFAQEICNALDDDCDGATDEDALGSTSYFEDGDGDGYGFGIAIHSCTPLTGNYSLNALDCDDSDTTQNPQGLELCNQEDDNCNGDIDENASDAPVWYSDSDSDSFGNPLIWEFSCDTPNGYVSDGNDCNDQDANIHPNAQEVCNQVDDDCNFQIDNDVEKFIWYTDADSDGFGDVYNASQSCYQPEGMVANNDDCDDTDEFIHPNADEICSDSIDNNCDGTINEAQTAVDAFRGYTDDDGDGFAGGELLYDCDEPFILDESEALTSNYDCDDVNAEINPSATEICDSIDNDCDGNIDSELVCPCTATDCPDCDFYTYEGHNYLFCTSESAWDFAKGGCISNPNYHLVTINNQAENDWLISIIDSYSYDYSDSFPQSNSGNDSDGDGYRSSDDCNDNDNSIYPGATEYPVDGIVQDCDDTYWWTGLNDKASEGLWDWDGPFTQFFNWGVGQPTGGTDKNCTAIHLSPIGNWEWVDGDCYTPHKFICETDLP